MNEYKESLKDFRDLKGVIDTSFEEGIEEGIEKGKEQGIAEGKIVGKTEMARELKKEGISIDIIAETSGLSKEEIEKL
jgi:predicted transposase/invertase (TIGR01784 family)